MNQTALHYLGALTLCVLAAAVVLLLRGVPGDQVAWLTSLPGTAFGAFAALLVQQRDQQKPPVPPAPTAPREE
jgi:hypothetical protein